MTEDQTPDRDLAAELRRIAGREWVEEAAEDERLSETLRRRRIDLKDAMAELANRGDRVSAEFGGHSFSGAIVATGEDFARIEGPGQVGDIRLERARWSILVTGDPPQDVGDSPDSFLALLRTFEADGSNVRLALPGADVVVGRITVVAVDHVEVTDVDGRKLYVPTDLILAAIRSTELH